MPKAVVTPSAKEMKSKALDTKRIDLLEMPPQDDWFIEDTSQDGKKVWYVRFVITGQRPRIFGPFPSRRAGLFFLDDALNALCEFWTEADGIRDKYACEVEFEHVAWGPLVEHPLAARRLESR